MALRRACVLAAFVWACVSVWTVLATEPMQPREWLIAAHVVVALLTLGILRSRAMLAPVGIAYYALLFYDYYSAPAIDGALCLAANWLGNCVHTALSLLVRNRWARLMPVVAALAVGVSLDAYSPIWSPALTSANVVTAIAIVAAAGVTVPRLWTLAEAADVTAEEVAQQRQSAEYVTRASREAADDARTLHDTVINTLAAVAVGGAAVEDLTLVRERCRRDLVAVRALLGHRATSDPESLSRVDADAAKQYRGLVVRRTGLDDQAILALEVRLPDEVSRALNAAVRELVRNVAKHAHAAEVSVDIQQVHETVVVTVADDGIGFDGVSIPGRGLAESVIARVAAVGGQVSIESARGVGTRVVVRYPLESDGVLPGTESDDHGSSDNEALIERIRWWACWLWSGAVVLVGFSIQAVNRPGGAVPTYVMLTLVAVLAALAWFTARRTGSPPTWVIGALIAGVPGAFLLGMVAIGFGDGDAFYYQAWALTPLLVALITVGKGRGPLVAGLLGLSGAALVATVIVWRDSSVSDAAVMVVGAAPALLLAVGWLGFHRLIGVIVRRADADRRASLALQLDAVARVAATNARARWRAAELNAALDLVSDLADGRVQPSDPDVRRRAGVEEAYLRQLIQLSPDVFRMAEVLTRALASAHQRGVELVVRTGAIDAPDDAAARVLGRVVFDAVESAPPGSVLTIGLFRGPAGPQFTIVAPAPTLSERLPSWSLDLSAWAVRHTVLDAEEMVEIGWVTTPPSQRAHPGPVGAVSVV